MAALSGAVLPEGMIDHGVAVPISNSANFYVSSNAAGDTLLLRTLSDSRGCRDILEINVNKGTGRTVRLPSRPGIHSLFTSLYSSSGKLYLAHGGKFYEYDPKAGKVTFDGRCSGSSAIVMHEDRHGRIWAGSYPSSELCMFDPKTRKLTDFGKIHSEDWRQYPRFIADDDAGWIYVGIGNTFTQIVAFHPETGTSKAIIPEESRRPAAASQVEAADSGKVYGWNRTVGKDPDLYYELHRGQVLKLSAKPDYTPRKLHYACGSNPTSLPDGRKIESFDLVTRELKITDPDGRNSRTINFSYPSDGLYIMGFVPMADGTLRGGTMHPMHYFVFDPAKNEFVTHGPAHYQWNVLLSFGNHLFIGGYSHGALLDWDIDNPRFDPITEQTLPGKNPRNIGLAFPAVNRPSALVMTPDERYLLMSGTPGYGRTGGGLAIYDRKQDKLDLIQPDRLLGMQSIASMLSLSDRHILLGGTVSPGTGGRTLAQAATLAVYDLTERKIVWNEEIIPGLKQYTEMLRLSDGRILIAGERDRLAVFNPETRKIEKITPLVGFGSLVLQQGSRTMYPNNGRVLLILDAGIAEYGIADARLRQLLKFPKGITATGGGALIEGRLYFSARSRLYSYPVK